MAFQFPADPAPNSIVVNSITGSTYQWRVDLDKWVITSKKTTGESLIWEGDYPPNPIGDYKLWYSTDTLELYYHYCDENGVCAWMPTSAPITMVDDLDNTVFELRRDLTATNVAVRENENMIGRTIYFGDTAPTIYPDVVIDGATYPNELNYKFWYDDARLELLILFRDADGDDSYLPVSIPLESLPEPGVSQETFTYTTGSLHTAIQANYLHNLNQDESIDELKEDVNGLTELIKGKVFKYTVDNNVGNIVSRPGDISTNSGFWSSVSWFSFGTADADGNETPAMANGDVINIYSAEDDKTSQYEITNASGAPTLVEVKYLSGDVFITPSFELEVRIIKNETSTEPVAKTPAISPHLLQYTPSSSSLGNGMYVLSSTILIYRYSMTGQQLPELKVGDQFATIKPNGDVVRVEVTQRKGLIGGFLQFAVNSLTPGVTLGSDDQTEAYPINLVFY